MSQFWLGWTTVTTSTQFPPVWIGEEDKREDKNTSQTEEKVQRGQGKDSWIHPLILLESSFSWGQR